MEISSQEVCMDTRIYIATTKSLEDEEKFSSLLKTVSKYRQQKVDNYKTPAEKRLSLGVGVLLSRALEKEGYDEKKLQMLSKDNGRPYFKGHEEVFFSLSHSGERVMCAISSQPIGCDVQIISDDAGLDIETWPKIEAYSKASDTNLVDLLGGKVSFNQAYHFKELEWNDGYKYVICSIDEVGDSQIEKVEL